MDQAIDNGVVDNGTLRADLMARIAALDVRAPYLSAAQIAPQLDAIRLLAHRGGFDPAVTVAHFLGKALGQGDVAVHGWLALLADAVGSEAQDLAACDAYAAACSERLAA
ncbi:hypothetical protein Q5H91_08120 [Sphingomonas sp. KR1UV-12]|uniref:Uncharacterized protein n=1 Tax=Sphingomonas aurea TaxID=3063994 RepID=A0ABT9EJN5_9SPHN|nr:hypothetical protein [Sphingomonas sp. KR1UV-12]MDP1027174.1 hypothetical protein [Sphingomonas sp. KR1UV-12]